MCSPGFVHPSPALVTFCERLGLPLTEPQKRHLINLADGILVTEGKKTLANIQRQFSRSTRTFQHRRFPAHQPLAHRRMCGGGFNASWSRGPWKSPRPRVTPEVILVAVDDSIAEKDKQTSHLEAVDWHYDHLEGRKATPFTRRGWLSLLFTSWLGVFIWSLTSPSTSGRKTVRRHE